MGLSEDQTIANYRTTGHVCGDHIDIINGFLTGAVPMSLEKDSLWEDLDCACTFLDRSFVNHGKDRPRVEGLQLSHIATTAVQDADVGKDIEMNTEMGARLTQT